jgi:hypothetical protein
MPNTEITPERLLTGCREFSNHEHRDAMYRISRLLVDDTWDESGEVADALGVVLLTWNHAFYRYGPPNFDRIEQVVRVRHDKLSRYRSSDLLRLSRGDIDGVTPLFEELLDASSIRIAKTGEIRRSPVSVAKALHVLAPRTFPLWDDAIRKALGFGGDSNGAACQYVRFMHWCQGVLEQLNHQQSLAEIETDISRIERFPKTILKYLDEYLYARYTKRWI